MSTGWNFFGKGVIDDTRFTYDFYFPRQTISAFHARKSKIGRRAYLNDLINQYKMNNGVSEIEALEKLSIDIAYLNFEIPKNKSQRRAAGIKRRNISKAREFNDMANAMSDALLSWCTNRLNYLRITQSIGDTPYDESDDDLQNLIEKQGKLNRLTKRSEELMSEIARDMSYVDLRGSVKGAIVSAGGTRDEVPEKWKKLTKVSPPPVYSEASETDDDVSDLVSDTIHIATDVEESLTGSDIELPNLPYKSRLRALAMKNLKDETTGSEALLTSEVSGTDEVMSEDMDEFLTTTPTRETAMVRSRPSTPLTSPLRNVVGSPPLRTPSPSLKYSREEDRFLSDQADQADVSSAEILEFDDTQTGTNIDLFDIDDEVSHPFYFSFLNVPTLTTITSG